MSTRMLMIWYFVYTVLKLWALVLQSHTAEIDVQLFEVSEHEFEEFA